jgi:WD40 repeat protein
MSSVSFETWRVKLHDFVTALSFSNDGKILAVSLGGGDLALIHVPSGEVIERIRAHTNGCIAIAWNPSRSCIATGGQDGKVRFWTPFPLTQVFEESGGSAWVDHLKWSRDGNEIAIGSGKHLILLGADGKLRWQFSDHESSITALEWHAERNEFATACYKSVRVFSNAENSTPLHFPGTSSFVSLGWSPDARFLCAGTQDASVHLWQLPFQEGREMEMQGFPMKVKHLDWKRDGSELATASSNVILVWDSTGPGPAGKKPLQLAMHSNIITALKYGLQDPNFLASGDEAGLLLLWSPQSTTNAATLAKLDGEISALEWSSRARCLAAGSGEGEVSLIGKSEVLV